jgi:hypothetical protein
MQLTSTPLACLQQHQPAHALVYDLQCRVTSAAQQSCWQSQQSLSGFLSCQRRADMHTVCTLHIAPPSPAPPLAPPCTASYAPGSTISIHLVITANHWGRMEFRLCPYGTTAADAQQRCVVLQVRGGGHGSRHTGREGPARSLLSGLQLPGHTSLPCSVHCWPRSTREASTHRLSQPPKCVAVLSCWPSSTRSTLQGIHPSRPVVIHNVVTTTSHSSAKLLP